jgi:hypothetical protein
MGCYATGIEKLNNRNYNHWDEFYTEKKISNILKKQEKIIFIFKTLNILFRVEYRMVSLPFSIS